MLRIRLTAAAAASVVVPMLAPPHAAAQLVGETPQQAAQQKRAEELIANHEKLKRRRALPASYASSKTYDDPTVTMSAADACIFGSAMRSLSAQGGVAILAEDTPLHAILPEAASADLTRALAASDGHFNSVLAIIADAFDYRPIRIDSGTVLLSKEFHDPDDLPFVTYDEALYDLKATKRIVSAIDPDLPVPIAPNSPLIKFLIEATDQFGTGALRAGLPISQYPPSQSETAQKYATLCYLGGAFGPADQILIGLNGLRSPESAFVQSDLSKTGFKVIGFEGPFRYDGHQSEFIISHGFRYQYGGVSVRNGSPRLVLGGYSKELPPSTQPRLVQAVAKGLSDPGAPTDADYVPQPVLPETTTLADLAKKLDALAPKPDLTISLNPALQTKPVTLFGEAALKPEDIWRDMSILYGLRVQHLQDGVAYLTMASAAPVNSLEEAVPAIERMYPQPWLRALLGGAEHAEPLTFQAAVPAAEKKDAPFLEVRLRAHMNAPENAKNAIFDATVHRLRVLIEPELKKSPQGRFPMSEMNDEEKRLFALMYACDFLQGVDSFTSKNPPRSLLDRSQLVISGMLDAPTGSSNFWFGYIDSYGHFQFEGGAQMPTPKEYQGTNTQYPK